MKQSRRVIIVLLVAVSAYASIGASSCSTDTSGGSGGGAGGSLPSDTTTTSSSATTSAPSAPQKTLRYHGNGGLTIGDLRITQPSTLKWTNDGELFQIFSEDFSLSVNSGGHSGSSYVAPGTYKNVQVNAVGNWTITIRAQ